MNKEKLKPCKCQCGTIPDTDSIYRRFYVFCPAPGCGRKSDFYETEKEAIVEWNKHMEIYHQDCGEPKK